MDFENKNNICLIKTNKYKTISIYFNFSKEYDLKSKLIINLLGRIVGDYSVKYPTKELMTKAKDMLYGVNTFSSAKVKANLLLYSIKYTFINPKFLKDVTIDDYINFFDEIFNNVLLNEDLLNEYKKVYKDSIARKLDKPSTLSLNRTIQIIGEHAECFNAYDIDHIKEIDSITLDDVKHVYENLLNDFSLNIFVYGDVCEKLVNYLEKYKSSVTVSLKNKSLELGNIGQVIETKDVSQSCINYVYQTPFNRLSKEFYAFTLGNILFGVIPTSLLFEEIREKLSLCYQISAIDYKSEGLVRVVTLFDRKNTDTVIEKIDEQFKRMINKDYDPIKLDMAKALLIDSLHSSVDDADSFVDFIYNNKLNGIDCSLNEYEDNVLKVSVDDISKVFKNYKHVLTYVLKGVKDE